VILRRSLNLLFHLEAAKQGIKLKPWTKSKHHQFITSSFAMQAGFISSSSILCSQKEHY